MQSELVDNCVRPKLVEIMRLESFGVRVHDVIGTYSGTRLSAGAHCASQAVRTVSLSLGRLSNSTCKPDGDVFEVTAGCK